MALFNRYNEKPETLKNQDFALVRTISGFILFVGDEDDKPVPYGEEDYKNQSPFVMKWNISADGETLNFPQSVSAIENMFEVDWGDGTVEKNAVSHTYQNAGEYTVKIKGFLYNFDFPESYTEGEKLTEIVSWGDIAYYIIRFKSARNLAKIPMDEKAPNFENVRFVDRMFYRNKLEEIPANLLRRAVICEDFYETFAGNLLKDIPNVLERCVNARSFFGTFRYNQIETVSKDLFRYCTKARNFTVTFQDNNLTSIPSDFFRYNIEGNNFTNTFRGNNILEFPNGIHATSRIDAIHFQEFGGNTEMTGVADPIWLKKMKTPSDMFGKLTNLDNYDEIPVAWGGNYQGEYNIAWQHENLYWDFDKNVPCWYVDKELRYLNNTGATIIPVTGEKTVTKDDEGAILVFTDFADLTIEKEENISKFFIYNASENLNKVYVNGAFGSVEKIAPGDMVTVRVINGLILVQNFVLGEDVTLDFPETPANSFSEQYVNVRGVKQGDVVSVGHKNQTQGNNFYQAWVSSGEKVTIRYCNVSSSVIESFSMDFKIRVNK